MATCGKIPEKALELASRGEFPPLMVSGHVLVVRVHQHGYHPNVVSTYARQWRANEYHKLAFHGVTYVCDYTRGEVWT